MKSLPLLAAVFLLAVFSGCRKPDYRKEFSYGKYQFTVTAAADMLYLSGRHDGKDLEPRGSWPLGGQTLAWAELADLNADGYPEIYTYAKPAVDGPGAIMAYACKEPRCVSIGVEGSAGPAVPKGFCGGDGFRLDKDALLREFDVCGKDGGPKSRSQLRYKLEENSFGYILKEIRN